MMGAISQLIDLTTVICHEPSVSAAKLMDPADTSLTIWWRTLAYTMRAAAKGWENLVSRVTAYLSGSFV
jgi:hypothetical protein